MARGYGIPPVAAGRRKEERQSLVTLTDDEMKDKVAAGEIRVSDLSISQRERYRHLAPLSKKGLA